MNVSASTLPLNELNRTVFPSWLRSDSSGKTSPVLNTRAVMIWSAESVGNVSPFPTRTICSSQLSVRDTASVACILSPTASGRSRSLSRTLNGIVMAFI